MEGEEDILNGAAPAETTPPSIPETPETPAPEPTIEEQVRAASEEVKARPRSSDGKFTKAAPEAPAMDKPATEAAPSDPAATAPTKPTREAPLDWSPGAKAKWGTLPPDVQAEIARREAHIHKEMTRLDTERNIGKQFKSVVDPFMPEIQANGVTPYRAVQEMLQAAKVLRSAPMSEKVQMVRTVCATHGIDLAQLASGAQSQPFADPRMSQMDERLGKIERAGQEATAAAERQETTRLQAQIDAFEADPKHPHYHAVKADMAALLQAGRAKDMSEAYDMACWARPDIRSGLQAEQARSAEEKRLADLKARAGAARHAGGSVTGSRGVGITADPKAAGRSLEDDIRAALTQSRE